MKRSKLRRIIVTCVLLTAVVVSGCSILPGKEGGSSGVRNSGNRKHSDKYNSAEEYCGYWFGPCEEIGTHKLSEGTDVIVHEMKDTEFGFEYNVSEGEKSCYFSGSDFGHYYLLEFVKKADLDHITQEYDLIFETSEPDPMRSPSIKIRTERELSAEDNRMIIDEVIGQLEQFDSGRNVFNKKHDNIHAAISVWSAPWEQDKKTGALYHVENDTFGDNYTEQ